MPHANFKVGVMSFSVRPLDAEAAAKTYPLAQALGIAEFDRWRAFVIEHASGAEEGEGEAEYGGIVAEDARGYAAGLFCYRIDRRALSGAALVCDPFLVADLPRYDAPALALLAEAERLAERGECRWLRVVLPAAGDPLAGRDYGCEAMLVRSGFALETVSFRSRRPIGKNAQRSLARALAERRATR
jgi:hypothetical protein